jgi:hypothetical protein
MTLVVALTIAAWSAARWRQTLLWPECFSRPHPNIETQCVRDPEGFTTLFLQKPESSGKSFDSKHGGLR